MEEGQIGVPKKLLNERKLIRDLDNPNEIQQEETKEEREDSFVEVKKKRKKKKKAVDGDQGPTHILPQLDL